MAKLTLVIGSKNLCPWSLGPWLLLKQSGIVFEESVVRLEAVDAPVEIARVSPSGKVPVLLVDDVPIWDSLAIAEFLAEHVTTLWPVDPQTRAEARSITAELHSEFQALQAYLPMDFTGRFGPPGKLLFAVEQDVGRIQAIWQGFRGRFQAQGPFLCGAFSIADAMFASVCAKFTTYAIPLRPEVEAYRETMMSLPAMQEWAEAAAKEVQSPVAAGQLRQITPPPQTAPPALPVTPPVTVPLVAAPPVAAPSSVEEPPIAKRPIAAPLPAPRPAPQPRAPVTHGEPPPERQQPPAPSQAMDSAPAKDVGPPRPRRHWLRSPMFREQRARELAAVDNEANGTDVDEAAATPDAADGGRPDTGMIKPIGAGTLRRR